MCPFCQSNSNTTLTQPRVPISTAKAILPAAQCRLQGPRDHGGIDDEGAVFNAATSQLKFLG